MKIKAPFQRGVSMVGAVEVIFEDFCSEVPDDIGRKLLSRPGYTLASDSPPLWVPRSTYAPPPEKAKHVLITFGAGELGDRYLFLAVLRAFKKANPTIKLDVSLTPSERAHDGYVNIFRNNAFLNEVFVGDPPAKTYHKVLRVGAETVHDAEYKPGGLPKSRMELWGEQLGVSTETLESVINEDSLIDYTPQDIDSVSERLKEFKGKILVGIAPFSSNKFKEWPIWRWQQLIDTLVEKYNCICFILHAASIGSTPQLHSLNEARFNNSFLIDNLNYKELSLFIKHMSILVGVEAAHTNIAGLVGTPVVTFAGPQSGASYIKHFRRSVVLERKEWPCTPCWYPFSKFKIDPNSPFGKECRHLGFAKCIYDIGVSEVVNAFEQLLEVKKEDTFFLNFKNHGPFCVCSFCVIKYNLTKGMKQYDYVIEDTNEDLLPKGINLGYCCTISRRGKRFLMQLYEASKIPKKWVNYFRENYDYMICVSDYLYDVFLSSGIEKEKLIMWSLGVNTGIFNDCGATGIIESKKFRFLNVGAITPMGVLDRKGRDILIQCYRDTFKGRDDVVLTIKADKPLPRELQGKPKVEVIHHVYSETDMANLFRTTASNGVYIATDRAEGFRMPALEALACGCAIGIPEFSGNANMLKPYAALFPCKKVSAGNFFFREYYGNGESPMWGSPDRKKICAWMLSVVDKKPRTAHKTVLEIHKKYSWGNLVPQLLDKIKRLS